MMEFNGWARDLAGLGPQEQLKLLNQLLRPGSRVVILRFGNHGATHDLYDLSSKS